MATLKDVAQEAGLTVSTVSRVLNNRGYISEDARNRVSAAMKKLNYRPNELARSLQNKTSMTIGVIVPHIRHPYFAEMIDALEEAAYRKGYRILLCNSRGKEDRESQYVEMCNANRVAGIILCTGGMSAKPFEMMNVPIVAIERSNENCDAMVGCDNRMGGMLAARRLIDAGCKKVISIGNVVEITMPADMRMESFEEVCREAGVECIPFLTQLGMYNSMQYEEMICKLLKDNPDIDGIFASSDVIGAQVIQACRAMNISIPEDLKVVSFDDVSLAGLTSPRLTTIKQPIKEMAAKAIETLADLTAGKTVEREYYFPVELIERESVE